MAGRWEVAEDGYEEQINIPKEQQGEAWWRGGSRTRALNPITLLPDINIFLFDCDYRFSNLVWLRPVTLWDIRNHDPPAPQIIDFSELTCLPVRDRTQTGDDSFSQVLPEEYWIQ